MKGILAVALLLLGTIAAEASPITGGFSIVGNFTPVNGQTGAAALLGSASGLDFLNLFGGSTPTPGVPGTILATQGNGSFVGLAGTFGTIRDFSFAGPGSASFPNLSTPLLAFQNFGGFNSLTFTLTSIGVTTQNNAQLGLLGTGILSMTGFTSTTGTFNFTGNGANGTFSFSASNGAQVPEPASLALLGAGLLVCAATLSRRRRANH